ncbi:MAG: radical SAM-associated putative lipoprotein [Paludibacteraceae bacterium]|nr:radical SAM-associated putative lipoprotein [Paludibacteraceae bacterium]
MKKSGLFAALLAMLGLQLQSCEYGCPYTTFKTDGNVQDEKGDNIKDAKVSVKIDIITENQDPTGRRPDTIKCGKQTVFTNRKGHYETTHKDIDDVDFKTVNYEVITNKDGYEPDTIRKEVNKSEIRFKDGDTWETIVSHKINIVLKKK